MKKPRSSRKKIFRARPGRWDRVSDVERPYGRRPRTRGRLLSQREIARLLDIIAGKDVPARKRRKK